MAQDNQGAHDPNTDPYRCSTFKRSRKCGGTPITEHAGGLDNAATAIAELTWGNDGFLGDVLAVAPAHSAAAVRRLGWILEHVAEIDELDDLTGASMEKGTAPSYLPPNAPRGGSLDVRWNIFVNKEVDPDI